MQYRARLLGALGVILFLLVLGTVVYQWFEGWLWYDALFFSASTITTIGYGDIVPKTMYGRLFTVAYMLIGVATALYAFTIVAEHYFENHLPQVRERNAAFAKRVFTKRARNHDDTNDKDDDV